MYQYTAWFFSFIFFVIRERQGFKKSSWSHMCWSCCFLYLFQKSFTCICFYACLRTNTVISCHLVIFKPQCSTHTKKNLECFQRKYHILILCCLITCSWIITIIMIIKLLKEGKIQSSRISQQGDDLVSFEKFSNK